MFEDLPGGEILEAGLRDLAAGVRSIPSLLLLVAAPRLTRHGIAVPAGSAAPRLPEHELYDLLVATYGTEAFRYYRSLLRRLVSLENALDHRPTGDPPTRLTPSATSRRGTARGARVPEGGVRRPGAAH